MYYIDVLLMSPLYLGAFGLLCSIDVLCLVYLNIFACEAESSIWSWKTKKPLTCHGGALWDFPVMFMYRNLKLSWSLSRSTCQRTCAFAFCCGRDQILLSPRDPYLHIFSLIFRFLGAPVWLWQAKCFCRTLALSF